jgi:N6-adenosine-specific RNA methylase IME4
MTSDSGFYALASKRRDEVVEIADKLGRFDVIYVDFPWQFKAHSQKGMRRSAERHYDTMTLDEIGAYPIANFASPNCVLLMWATVPLLDKAIAVMSALGFTYKSGAVWDKTIAAFGFWFRNQHELLLLGTRGQPRAPLPPDRLPSVFTERRTAHSRKPDATYQAIERMFPDRRKVELFARPPGRPGWWAVGLDTTGGAAAFRAELQDLFRDQPVKRRLYQCLLDHPEGATRRQLMDHVYADDPDGGPDCENVVAVHVKHMRPILEREGLTITSERGPGSHYRIERMEK